MATLSQVDRVQAVEKIIGYNFVNPVNLRGALQAAGHLGGLHLPDGNKPLALLGDALLRLVLAEAGFQNSSTKGAIQNVISQRASNNYLAQQGLRLGLDEYIYKNQAQGTLVSANLRATTMEAIIGAVYVDSNGSMDAVRGVVTAMNVGWS